VLDRREEIFFDDGMRFAVQQKKMTASLELEAMINGLLGFGLTRQQDFSKLDVAKRI